MFSKKQRIILFVLLLGGFLVAAKLYHIDYMVNYSGEPYKSFCNINETFNCDAVAASPYSHLFNIPIAFIGTVVNLFLIIFLWVGSRLTGFKDHLKNFYIVIFFFYSLGCIALALISFLFVPSFCFVCMIFWVIVFCTFGYLISISDRGWRSPKNIALGMLRGISQHKMVIFCFGAAFIAVNAYEGYRHSSSGCAQKSQNHLQCEHFDLQSQMAFLGRESAKIDVVNYTDFQCPWCRRAHYALTDLVKKHEKQVRFIRKEFPLDIECNPLVTKPFHNIACKAAFYSKCAGQQGKYWEYHDELYKNQEILSEEVFINIGKMLSLDIEKLQECSHSDDIRRAVQREIEEASQYQVSGTPTFRIFGELFIGMIEERVLNDYLSFYPAIKPEVLKRISSGQSIMNIQLIDIREESEFKKGHIDGALNVPYSVLKLSTNINIISPTRPTLLYDQNGTNVTQAFDIFKRQGFTMLHTLLDGYDGWISYNNEHP